MRIQICGQVAIERDGHRLDASLPGRQGRLLFTYLIVNRHRQVPRDELAEALWREPDPAAVDTRLSPLLSKLRRVFGADAVDGRSILRLCLPDAWVDLEAAAEAIHRAESSVAQQDWARAWGPALTALIVAERGFLPGEEARWIDEIRHQLYFDRPLYQQFGIYVDHVLHGDLLFPKAYPTARFIYLWILLTPHILLAVVCLPMILITFFLSLTGRFPAHRKLARWTYPIWLYVSVSGVIVYAMLAAYR